MYNTKQILSSINMENYFNERKCDKLGIYQYLHSKHSMFCKQNFIESETNFFVSVKIRCHIWKQLLNHLSYYLTFHDMEWEEKFLFIMKLILKH